MWQYNYTDELYHYGVLGMKWGRRKSQRQQTKAANYSSKQRSRDKAIYGEGAVKRIDKRMQEGAGIQEARHYEVKRKDRKVHAKSIAKTITKGAVVVGGTVAVTALIAKYGGKTSKTYGGVIVDTSVNTGKKVVNAIFGR